MNLAFGLFGASIGAAVAYLIHARVRHDRTRANAFTTLIRAQMIFSDFQGLKLTIGDFVRMADEKGYADSPMWLKAGPISGVPQPTSFPPEELVFLAENGEYDLMQDLILMGMRHVGLIDSVITFNKLRTEIRDHLPVDSFKDNVFVSKLNAAEQKRLQPRMLELSTLVGHLTRNAEVYTNEGGRTVVALSSAGKKIFGAKNFPAVRFEIPKR